MKPRALVVSSIHHADDNRIREKTIRALAPIFDVTYAARTPGPTDPTGLAFAALEGGRMRRDLDAGWKILSGRYDLVSIHDPELLPFGIVAGLLRRCAVVFDMHEDVPAQILTKDWVPPVCRRPLAALMRLVLRIAERYVTVTVAESDYLRRFRHAHPLVPNAPRFDGFPETVKTRERRVIYVGDVTPVRGVFDLVRACGLIGVPLMLVGPAHAHGSDLRAAASAAGTRLTMTGRLPHPQALEEIRRSMAGVSPLHDIPNYRESVPTKILEYLALGVPVAASDLPATRRLVDGLEAVELYPPGDVDRLAAAISTVLDDGIRAAAVGQASAVRSRHAWDDHLVQGIYTTAMTGRPTRIRSTPEETEAP